MFTLIISSLLLALAIFIVMIAVELKRANYPNWTFWYSFFRWLCWREISVIDEKDLRVKSHEYYARAFSWVPYATRLADGKYYVITYAEALCWHEWERLGDCYNSGIAETLMKCSICGKERYAEWYKRPDNSSLTIEDFIQGTKINQSFN